MAIPALLFLALAFVVFPPTAILLFVYPVYVVYVFLTDNKVEFYGDFLRVFSPGGKPTEIPYSQLQMDWFETGFGPGQWVRTKCELSLLGSGINGPSWPVENAYMKKLNTRLFIFLKQKKGTLTEEERRMIIDKGRYSIPEGDGFQADSTAAQ